MSTLYARLPDHEGRLLLRQFDGLPIDAVRNLAKSSHPAVTYAPTGGVPASSEHLNTCVTMIRSCASQFGYPAQPDTRARTSFDRTLACQMHQTMDIVPAEAAVPEIWTFMACQLVPDVVLWRWGINNEERWIGRGLVRHAFGRLWWQAHVLVTESNGLRDYSLVEQLLEADLNQVFERRTIGGIPPLARALAYHLSAPQVGAPGVRQRDVVRDVTKRVRRMLPYTSFLSIDQSTVNRRVAELVRESVQQLRAVHDRAHDT